MIKKVLLSICLVLCIFPLSVTSAFADESLENSQDIPEDAIVLLEKEQTYYYDSSTGQFVEKTTSIQPKTLFEIKCKHTWYQVTGGKIDVGIQVTSTNIRAQIKRIRGTHTMSDTQSSATNGVSINTTSSLPTYIISNYTSGTKKFTKGHKIKCKLNYYISLVSGSVLNGGQITNTEYVTIVR